MTGTDLQWHLCDRAMLVLMTSGLVSRCIVVELGQSLEAWALAPAGRSVAQAAKGRDGGWAGALCQRKTEACLPPRARPSLGRFQVSSQDKQENYRVGRLGKPSFPHFPIKSNDWRGGEEEDGHLPQVSNCPCPSPSDQSQLLQKVSLTFPYGAASPQTRFPTRPWSRPEKGTGRSEVCIGEGGVTPLSL